MCSPGRSANGRGTEVTGATPDALALGSLADFDSPARGAFLSAASPDLLPFVEPAALLLEVDFSFLSLGSLAVSLSASGDSCFSATALNRSSQWRTNLSMASRHSY